MGMPSGYSFPASCSRVGAAFDIRDLGRGEGHDFIIGVIAEEDVEVMEIAPGGAHDEGTDG